MACTAYAHWNCSGAIWNVPPAERGGRGGVRDWGVAEALPGAAVCGDCSLYGGCTERARAHRSRRGSAVPGRHVQYTK
jgi:hypothetical protein